MTLEFKMAEHHFMVFNNNKTFCILVKMNIEDCTASEWSNLILITYFHHISVYCASTNARCHTPHCVQKKLS